MGTEFCTIDTFYYLDLSVTDGQTDRTVIKTTGSA